jgi:hypothetical protein
MTSKQIAALKKKSLAKWRKIATEGAQAYTLLGAEDCGYCEIYFNMCRDCPLFRVRLCDGGNGRAYWTVHCARNAVRLGDNRGIEKSKAAAAVMVAAIARDIARDAKTKRRTP